MELGRLGWRGKILQWWKEGCDVGREAGMERETTTMEVGRLGRR